MSEIKCPHCGQIFQVDENEYNQILSQVRDKEFTRELERRQQENERARQSEIKLISMESERKRLADAAKKDEEINRQEREISNLKAELEKRDAQQQLAVAKAVQEKSECISKLEQNVAKLSEQLKSNESEKELAVSKAVEEKNQELFKSAQRIKEMEGRLSNKDTERRLSEKSLQEKFDEQIKRKDEEIEYYRDLKARQSTKMIGESLEQHCLTEFNRLRMTAFPNAYFEKDNDARSGSKGDFIYRESEDGVEYISIMFEMKNEADTTATKHKNEDFFKELDKDRREKGCEYAVLVSLLEIDSDLYNAGIVDVSYRYPKMYVIRPQFFIPIITLLRNASRNSLQYQRELAAVRSQQLDVSHFEENMQAFKTGFARNYQLASDKFKAAVEEIDKSISHLQKIKDNLLSSENQLRLANNKADELSIRKLTKNAPSVREKFEEMKKNGDEEGKTDSGEG